MCNCVIYIDFVTNERSLERPDLEELVKKDQCIFDTILGVQIALGRATAALHQNGDALHRIRTIIGENSSDVWQAKESDVELSHCDVLAMIHDCLLAAMAHDCI